MDKMEFQNYILNRETKNLLFLELNKIIEFKEMIYVEYPITMVGKYITQEDIKYYLGKI